MNYIIYKITNKINQKIYIGRTTQSLQKRWSIHKAHSKYWKKYFKKSKSYLYASIDKYKIENFDIQEIDRAVDFNSLVKLEAFYIKKFSSNNPHFGYNLIIDTYGKGLEFLDENIRRKISAKSHTNRHGGVTWDKTRNRWLMTFSFLNRSKIKKRFNKEEDAKICKDKLSLLFFKESAQLYYEEKRQEYLCEDLQKFYDELLINKKISKNRYKGISFCKNGFNVRVGNPRIFVGWFKIEEEAKVHQEKVLFFLNNKNNYINIKKEYQKMFREGKEIYDFYSTSLRQGSRKRKIPKKSIYKGITKCGENLWEASLTVNGQRWRTRFKTEKDAALAFNRKIIELGLIRERLNVI